MESAASTGNGPTDPNRPKGQSPDGWPTEPRQFGQAVSQHIDRHGLPPQKLAKEAGLSMSTIRSVRKGKHRATQDTRQRLIRAFATLTPADSVS